MAVYDEACRALHHLPIDNQRALLGKWRALIATLDERVGQVSTRRSNPRVATLRQYVDNGWQKVRSAVLLYDIAQADLWHNHIGNTALNQDS